jgi:hypothetical protein
MAADEATHLLTTVHTLSALGSRMAFGVEEIDASTLREQPVGYMFWPGTRRCGTAADIPDWLAGHGWRWQAHDAMEVSVGYGRAGRASPRGFITATRS